MEHAPVAPSPKKESKSPRATATATAFWLQTVVLEEEATQRFMDLLLEYMDEHQPSTATQVCLVETMAVARWRQLRVWGAQRPPWTETWLFRIQGGTRARPGSRRPERHAGDSLSSRCSPPLRDRLRPPILPSPNPPAHPSRPSDQPATPALPPANANRPNLER